MNSVIAESKETPATRYHTKDAFSSTINERNVSFTEGYYWKEDCQNTVNQAAKAHSDCKRHAHAVYKLECEENVIARKNGNGNLRNGRGITATKP